MAMCEQKKAVLKKLGSERIKFTADDSIAALLNVRCRPPL
jgi:hypothetical protein